MYESEVNDVVEPVGTIPAEILARFAESRDQIVERTLLPWGEHCTECSYPTCYTSCELYAARPDGACRLFHDGMVRVDHADLANGYLIKVRFKRWAKLWTVASLGLQSAGETARKERSNILAGAVARSIPLPRSLKARALRKLSYLRRQAVERGAAPAILPDCFMLECYNPNDTTVSLTLTVRSRSRATEAYHLAIAIPRGFTREEVPLESIAARVGLSRTFEVEIVPNDTEDTVLYFGVLDFVRRPPAPATSRAQLAGQTWKCIVWDLDNTLWDGILVEDGAQNIRVRQEVIDVIAETDRRGILHSVASKNNEADAMAVLQRFGVADYFLYPQISWRPKSEAVSRIAQLLNIGIDSIAFVDDQPFERGEVKAAHPSVTVVDAAVARDISSRAECLVPVTEESTKRRQMYRLQAQRDAVQESHKGDYLGFLKECDIELKIAPLSESNIDRVYELAQRTNQMNFSGNRYPRSRLAELSVSDQHETFVMSCEDRFGSYGIVGFAVVARDEPRLLDLMFSCRIQSKRVEHAFLGHLLKTFVVAQSRDFYADYRKTEKNAPSGRVFGEVGFEQVEERDGVASLVFRKGCVVPDDGIIRISEMDTQ